MSRLFCLFVFLSSKQFAPGAAEQDMHKTNLEEENKKLIKTISDMKAKLADLEARVSIYNHRLLYLKLPSPNMITSKKFLRIVIS